MRVAPAAETVFKLTFAASASGGTQVHATGRARIEGGEIHLDFARNQEVVGRVTDASCTLTTLHRNTVPFYARSVGGEVRVSNDVAELLVDGEEVHVRSLDMALAARNAARSVFSHLLEGIELLLPASIYRVKSQEGAIVLEWTDIAFDVQPRTTPDDFLEQLVERYRQRYADASEVLLGLSAGYDSRPELALLKHVRVAVRAYHYTGDAEEARLSAAVAEVVGADFRQFPSGQMRGEGWHLLRDLGYNTRWDGFFPPGTLASAGLYGRMLEEHAAADKLLFSTINGFKGRLYDQADLRRVALAGANFENVAAAPEQVERERARRRAHLEKVYATALTKTDEHDVLADVLYPFVWKSEGKCSTRSTFLFESGMPRYDADRQVREHFSALPRRYKDQLTFVQWATPKLNPQIAGVPMVTSARGRLVRKYGWAARVPGFKQILRALDDRTRDPNRFNFSADPRVRAMAAAVPELGTALREATDPRGKLALAQIALFLSLCQERKNVTFRVV
jgi:hypothetical protein